MDIERDAIDELLLTNTVINSIAWQNVEVNSRNGQKDLRRKSILASNAGICMAGMLRSSFSRIS